MAGVKRLIREILGIEVTIVLPKDAHLELAKSDEFCNLSRGGVVILVEKTIAVVLEGVGSRVYAVFPQSGNRVSFAKVGGRNPDERTIFITERPPEENVRRFRVNIT